MKLPFRNKIDRYFPDWSNPNSTVQRQLKGIHPYKQLVTWGRQFLRKVSKAKIALRLTAESLGSRLPLVPLSFRTAVESEAINIIVGGAFNARSKEGVVVGEKENKVLQKWGDIKGVKTDIVPQLKKIY